MTFALLRALFLYFLLNILLVLLGDLRRLLNVLLQRLILVLLLFLVLLLLFLLVLLLLLLLVLVLFLLLVLVLLLLLLLLRGVLNMYGVVTNVVVLEVILRHLFVDISYELCLA